jgi:energy-coupling factor transporter ATP-binding protein EcfA2
MGGRVAPFIELGVGFNPELSSRENVVLNGVIMGLTLREARRRLDAVLDFAELREFADLQLKNYSSGMMVRLAFAVMVQADTDILLIDEVLAVGDAAFQQKCADVFRRMRAEGKTIVLVTHDMRAVEDFCHRAMLLNEGCIVDIGDPATVARQYLRLNFEPQAPVAAEASADDGTGDVRLLDAWLESRDGKRITNVEQDEPIRLRAKVEARRSVPDALFGFILLNADGIAVHEFVAPFSEAPEIGDELSPGRTVTVGVDVENRLVPGRYFLHFGVARHGNRYDVALHVPNAFGFAVFGERLSGAMVSVDHQVTIEVAKS